VVLVVTLDVLVVSVALVVALVEVLVFVAVVIVRLDVIVDVVPRHTGGSPKYLDSSHL